MMRTYLIAGNWKMHGSKAMTTDLIEGIKAAVSGSNVEVLVCPSLPYLSMANEQIAGSGLLLGAQNVSAHSQGAHTGEVELSMLQEFGCSYVILGHSERRAIYGETDEQVADKFEACLETSIIPVLCVGETLADRQANNTESVIAKQLDAVLDKVGIAGLNKAVIAYEPVWAIGTGETASPEQAQQVHEFIRLKLAKLDASIANKVQILYGGSVKPSNAKTLFAQADIDGGLIGGAALNADDFVAICQSAHS